ncbi:OmpA family protein [uncultured Cohaesibacter sp.]|uniref:OmpA family protein n=1 Tax=uncultured Cohaesibacter sp. TaxID=1002546 RepID=UPI00292F94CE|nr:OmpA family protein [uncultured Cohaesibacter sp.]
MRVFSAPVGSSVQIRRDGKLDIFVKQSILVQQLPLHSLLSDIGLFHRLPGFISRDIRFEFGSAQLTVPARQYLDVLASQIAQSYRANPDLTLLIAGFTDAVGSAAYNLDLSARRAAAVKMYLTENYGFPSCLFNTTSFGELWDGLLVKTKQANALNRRVEIRSTDVLRYAGTQDFVFSCRNVGPATGVTIQVTPPPVPVQSVTTCRTGNIATSITLTLKGFNNSEFLTHFEKMWPTLGGYSAHHLEEIQPNLRIYRVDLTYGNCEILDDILRHLEQNGYRVDDAITTKMVGNEVIVEKL